MLHSVIYNYKINKDLEKSGQGKNYDIDRSKKAVLWQIYGEDLMNTGCIEISSYEAKDNCPHIWS